MDAGFARVDADIRELRSAVSAAEHGIRTDLGGEITAVRTDLGAEISALRMELRAEIAAFRTTLLRVGGGMMVGLVGVIAAVLAQG